MYKRLIATASVLCATSLADAFQQPVDIHFTYEGRAQAFIEGRSADPNELADFDSADHTTTQGHALQAAGHIHAGYVRGRFAGEELGFRSRVESSLVDIGEAWARLQITQGTLHVGTSSTYPVGSTVPISVVIQETLSGAAQHTSWSWSLWDSDPNQPFSVLDRTATSATWMLTAGGAYGFSFAHELNNPWSGHVDVRSELAIVIPEPPTLALLVLLGLGIRSQTV